MFKNAEHAKSLT